MNGELAALAKGRSGGALRVRLALLLLSPV